MQTNPIPLSIRFFIDSLLHSIFNPLFYVRSFKANRLPIGLYVRAGLLKLNGKLPMRHFHFVRKSLFLFEVHCNGVNTGLHYFIDENIID